mgnify:CR=1 FL=1
MFVWQLHSIKACKLSLLFLFFSICASYCTLSAGKGRTVGQGIRDIIDYTENPQKTDGGSPLSPARSRRRNQTV